MTEESTKETREISQQLAASKEIFRLLVDGVKDYAIFMTEPSGSVLVWNEGAERIFGFTAEEIIGRQAIILLPADSAQNQDSALNDGRFEEETWRLRKDGTNFWANVVITPVYEDGKLFGFAHVVRDLTERKAADQGEQIFKLLVSSVQDYAIFMLDANGIVATWNEGAERIKGYKASEIIGKHFSVFYSSESQATHHAEHELEIAKRDGRYEETGWRVRKDGSQFWANVTLTPIYNEDNLIGYAKVTRDLSERKASEQREAIFRLLVSGVSDYAIFMLNPDGTVMTWNEGAQRIKGYKSDEIIGKHFSIFYTKEAQKRKHPQKELEIAMAVGKYEEEGWRLRKDGSLLWANVVITAIYDNGDLVGFAKVTRDLTQRLLADQEREYAAKLLDETNTELRDALEVKSRFLSTISHEVRTPMSAIIGMAEMLTFEDLGEDLNSLVANMFQSSQRLLQLLNNLLDSAQLETGEVLVEQRLFPIRSVLGDIRQMIVPEAKAKALRVIGTCDPRIPEQVSGDELKLRQVLLNLTHNAVKFTPAGEINISAELTARGSDSVTIRFTVTDTGIGIDDKDKERLFEPFTQVDDATKRIYGGSGLGLSISKQLVERMGGTIGFDSTPDKGSAFTFELPFKLNGSAA